MQTAEWRRMSGGSWRDLIRAKRQSARFRIVLTVRGQRIVKEYTTEDDYRKWRETYEMHRENGKSGIEDIRTEVVY
jgi:hypothetical protein